MRVNTRSYLLNISILALALLLSVAIGAVFVPPDTLLRMILSYLPGMQVSGDWPETFAVIIFRIGNNCRHHGPDKSDAHHNNDFFSL